MRELRKIWPLFPPPASDPWRPHADVYRTAQGWLVKFDLAGVRPDDISIHLRGRKLAISGFRRDTVVEEGSTYYSMEISYNRFERTIELPANLEGASISLEAHNGILLVRLVVQG